MAIGYGTLFGRWHEDYLNEYKKRDSHVPLHLFRRYPFDIQLVMDDFNDFFQGKEEFNKQLKDIDINDIVEALNNLQSLNSRDEHQRRKILKSVEKEKDAVWEQHPTDTIFQRFVRYLIEVQRFFQDIRTIKNMLRDVSSAIVERGADSSVFLDQLHFLFEDLRNVTLATPFFNSMRTDAKRGELKVELWTIRNTLNALYFLNHTTRKYVLQKHSRIYVTKQNILDMVFELFDHDNIDPEGITDFVETDDLDDHDDMQRLYSDNGDAEVEEQTQQFLFAQKSTIGIGQFGMNMMMMRNWMKMSDKELLLNEWSYFKKDISQQLLCEMKSVPYLIRFRVAEGKKLLNQLLITIDDMDWRMFVYYKMMRLCVIFSNNYQDLLPFIWQI